MAPKQKNCPEIGFAVKTMKELDLHEIGSRIQFCRKRLGLTQEQLSEKMNVSIQMISNMERGNKAIRIDNLVKLSRILEVSTDYILTGKQNAADIHSISSKLSGLSEEDRKTVFVLIEYFLSKNE